MKIYVPHYKDSKFKTKQIKKIPMFNFPFLFSHSPFSLLLVSSESFPFKWSSFRVFMERDEVEVHENAPARPPPPHIKEEKKDHVYMQHNKPTLALSPFLPLLTSDQKWFRKETLQTAHEDKKEPCMSRLAFISWDIWTDIWFICSIFSTLFLTLIDFVHPTSTITLWSACEKTIKTKKDINAICGFIMPLKKKT